MIVDDSIVRGHTMKRLVAALRHQGVKEIHLRSSSPPLRHPCYFGIDIPQEAELVAAGRSVQEIADYIGVDSLGYLSLAGLGRALNADRGCADLNDGVVLNIAPLHELVPWREAETYWKELLEGEYEWSSIGRQLRQKGGLQPGRC